MLNNYTLWIGLPSFNEEDAIKNVLKKIVVLKKNIKNKKIKVVIFNDGSKDNTVKNAKLFKNKLKIHFIDNKKNQGLGIAIYSLFLYFKKKSRTNDKLILMDCDNTHNPNQILEMVKKGQKKKNFVVIASRYQKDSKVKNVPFIRNILSDTAFFVFNIFFKTKGIKDFTSGYRLYDKSAINNFFYITGKKYIPSSGFEMQLEIILKLRKTNVQFYEIPINLNYQKKPTKSKMKIIKTILSYLKLILIKN